MICFHGSRQKGIKILIPQTSPFSNLSYPCVYLTTNEALASIYVWNKPYKWMTFQINENGIPVYNESFKNGLYEFYKGVSGCIYRCKGDFETDIATHIKYAVISRSSVPVDSYELVDDAYEKILNYEKRNLLVINNFENLSSIQKEKDHKMVLDTIHNLNLLNGLHPLSAFVFEKFPSIWQEALNSEKSHFATS